MSSSWLRSLCTIPRFSAQNADRLNHLVATQTMKELTPNIADVEQAAFAGHSQRPGVVGAERHAGDVQFAIVELLGGTAFVCQEQLCQDDRPVFAARGQQLPVSLGPCDAVDFLVLKKETLD